MTFLLRIENLFISGRVLFVGFDVKCTKSGKVHQRLCDGKPVFSVRGTGSNPCTGTLKIFYFRGKSLVISGCVPVVRESKDRTG